jgi:hypothetical protein
VEIAHTFNLLMIRHPAPGAIEKREKLRVISRVKGVANVST